LVYNLEFNLPVTLPRIENLWVFAVMLALVVVSVVILFLDSSQAMSAIHRGNRQYVVLPRRIGGAFWNDLVNAHRHVILARLPYVVARVVVVLTLIKTLVGLFVMLLSWFVPVVIGWFGGVVAYTQAANGLGSEWYALGLQIIKYMGNEFGVFVFVYAVVVICADYVHTAERTFYNDYAIMQHQRK
jgi:hypothetical protein